MRKGRNQTSGIKHHLKSINALTGSPEALIAAKIAYWRQYKAAWRNAQRKRTKQYTVVLTPAEAVHIAAFAKKHKRSIIRFLKDAAFGYVDRRYVVPNEALLGEIRQLLSLNYTMLQRLRDDERVSPDNGRLLLLNMAELEHTVLSMLNNPKEYKNDML